MAIATEVARVCGARLNYSWGYNRWWELPLRESVPVEDSAIPEIVADIRAYVSRTRREILKKLKTQKCRLQKCSL